MADFETNPAEETKNPVQKITANGITEREKRIQKNCFETGKTKTKKKWHQRQILKRETDKNKERKK